ncbi:MULTISPECIES: DUF6011 domain-containing protein [unclassified Streptomyces]|uniref:DUF6011 domain-containing protein n=1 Tax=unclassified Streptomyces TaxID=2593676 RepID=UPI0006FEEA12|nr:MULTISPECIES: DUF6011 domain-containing protein [unclassified Streptomyces]KQX57348.1 hypothetical protein ASD33_26995 [Streptomyces sp. Root1304]KRA98720.1 hypothetical protein ASE09_23805 [Streptomyces sp. Root66D1]
MGDEPLAIPIDSASGAVARPVRCRLCGRPLTGAGSRRTGLGPTCDAKLHPPAPDIRTRRHEVEQDTLPGIDQPPS